LLYHIHGRFAGSSCLRGNRHYPPSLLNCLQPACPHMCTPCYMPAAFSARLSPFHCISSGAGRAPRAARYRDDARRTGRTPRATRCNFTTRTHDAGRRPDGTPPSRLVLNGLCCWDLLYFSPDCSPAPLRQSTLIFWFRRFGVDGGCLFFSPAVLPRAFAVRRVVQLRTCYLQPPTVHAFTTPLATICGKFLLPATGIRWAWFSRRGHCLALLLASFLAPTLLPRY
jgi:hypothetical protein